VLFWGFLFTLNTSEQMVNSFRIAKIEERSAIDRLMDTRRQKDANADVSDLEQERQNAEDAIRPLTTAHRILFAAKTILPKTDETVALVQRWTTEAANLQGVASEDDEADKPAASPPRRRGRGNNFGTVRAKERDVLAAIEREQRTRGVPWILGTSIGFEVVVLLIGCRIFARRDF
jgi:hypothetical protein